jgi:hypothetical protein
MAASNQSLLLPAAFAFFHLAVLSPPIVLLRLRSFSARALAGLIA